MLYILNSPILTSYGQYTFKKLTIKQATVMLKNSEFTSAVGHEATANFMSKILGINIPTNRVAITMRTGDKAIVFRVLTRLPEGKILSEEEVAQIKYEIGLLEKIA